MNKQALFVLCLFFGVSLVLLGVWTFQGQAMEADLIESLQSGNVRKMPEDLQGKRWSSDELKTVQVLKVPRAAGPEQGLTSLVQSRGRIHISPLVYEYQGTIQDNNTDTVHVFGYRRSEPRQWCWVRIHPESMKKHLQGQ